MTTGQLRPEDGTRDPAGTAATATTGEGSAAAPSAVALRPPRPRRQLGWMVPMAVVLVAFVAFSLPPYLTLDPSQSRLPGLRDGFPLYYPLLVTHIFFGSVALLSGCLQVWPWFRQRYPAAHRVAGRVYLFGGVLPAGVAVLGVAPLSSTGFVAQVGNTLLALLWLPITLVGYRRARQRRFAEHREWMIRSFALTTSIVVNRLWVVLCLLVVWPQLGTTYHGDETAMINAAAGAGVWLSWTVNLLVAEWWLQRGRIARGRYQRPAVPTQ